MTPKMLLLTATLSAMLLPMTEAADARGMSAGAPRAATSGALPRSSTSGALPASPNSAALPRTPTVTTKNLGAASVLTRPQPPVISPRTQDTAPYQAPCGTYPLPQC